MKKTFSFVLLSVIYLFVFSQTEELSNLRFNPALYYSSKSFQPGHQHKYLVDKGNIIVTSDTLSLPFVDDFSTNRTRSYKWVQNHITDTVYNVFGTCLAPEGVSTIIGGFMHDTAWSYSFDTLNKVVDSVALPSTRFNFFGPSTSNCFAQSPSPFYYWPTYYTYRFDSTTGKPIDSTLVDDPNISSSRHIDTIYYAPVIYFAKGEDGTLWFDNYAYVNNTFPVNPPTIGVATLDGLNEYGLPYNNSSTSTYGFADSLTSKEINLSGISSNDSSVFLSFFFEPQGLGDYPDHNDSLIVEFKNEGGIWQYMWADTGFTNPDSVPLYFKQVLLMVPPQSHPNSFFHSTFQFRFRNKASLYGSNDHWHIDYVKLDKNRSAADVIIHDIAFVYPFPTVLKNFTQLPADQFEDSTDLVSDIALRVHNLDSNAYNNPSATNFVKGADELYPTPINIANYTLETFNAYPDTVVHVAPSTEYAIPTTPNWPVDSLVLTSTVTINPNDARPQNDTLRHTQNLCYVAAYDDGSAEKAYGLSGLGLKKFAYEFNLHHPDTLSGFQVMFAQVEGNVSDLVFNFNAWDTLVFNDNNFIDNPFYSMENKKPYYIDSVNGFVTYKLDTPIVIPSKIYFGWAQTDTRRLQVGYDLNSTLGRQHMFIYTNATWKASSILPAGSPMIRLILDDNFWGTNSAPSAINNLQQEQLNVSVYPNPTTGKLNVKSANGNNIFEVSVTDILGRTIKTEKIYDGQLDISSFANGVYLLSLRDWQGKNFRTKIIKASN